MPAKTIMIQGTASNVGKSIVATALCRILTRQGYRVAPFKAQNMSNNSFPAIEGGEIGRAQAVQAEACGIAPSVLMNPVLLKPEADQKSQVVVMGKPFRRLSAGKYYTYQKELMFVVKQALRELMKNYDVVVIEGAGSPAEMNIKARDIVNMSVAKLVQSPVILVGDIDCGGIFAQLTGTLNLLSSAERKLVKGFIVNKFRGSKKILDPGLRWIEQRTHKKILGVLPYIHELGIAEEDSVALQKKGTGLSYNLPVRQAGLSPFLEVGQRNQLLIHVLKLPRISNFTDFEVLEKESDVHLKYVTAPLRNEMPDLVLIPGSKSTVADLRFLWQSGLADQVKRFAKAGVPIVGICGGYQMLGEKIRDPHGIESDESSCRGLGLLPAETTFSKGKSTVQVKATHLESGLDVEGYEIHMGKTKSRNGSAPLFQISERDGKIVKNTYDGIVSNNVSGTYIHGLFDQNRFRRFFLNQIRQSAGLPKRPKRCQAPTQCLPVRQAGLAPFDQLADIAEQNIDMKFLMNILQGKVK